jgi:hypothetical protein
MSEVRWVAIRNIARGTAHLDSGERFTFRGVTGAVGACRREVERFEVLPWDSTSPEDRCKRCQKMAVTR